MPNQNDDHLSYMAFCRQNYNQPLNWWGGGRRVEDAGGGDSHPKDMYLTYKVNALPLNYISICSILIGIKGITLQDNV